MAIFLFCFPMDESAVIPYPGIRDWKKPVWHSFLILNYGQTGSGFTGKILMKICRLKAFQPMWQSLKGMIGRMLLPKFRHERCLRDCISQPFEACKEYYRNFLVKKSEII